MSLRKLDMLTLFLRCVYRVVSLSLKEAIIKKMDVYFGGTTRADQFKMIFKRIWKHLNVIPHQHKIVLAAPVKGVKDLSTAPQDLQFQSDEHLKFCLRGERIPLQKTSAKWSNLLLYVKPPEPRSHQGQIYQMLCFFTLHKFTDRLKLSNRVWPRDIEKRLLTRGTLTRTEVQLKPLKQDEQFTPDNFKFFWYH